MPYSRLTLDDFKSDYGHLIVRGTVSKELVTAHIDTFFKHIKVECRDWLKEHGYDS